MARFLRLNQPYRKTVHIGQTLIFCIVFTQNYLINFNYLTRQIKEAVGPILSAYSQPTLLSW